MKPEVVVGRGYWYCCLFSAAGLEMRRNKRLFLQSSFKAKNYQGSEICQL